MAAIGAVILAGALLMRSVPVDGVIATLRVWAAERGAAGLVGFGAGYVILALLFVPGAPLTMISGAVYGVGWGIIVVGIATSVADAAAFLLGRHVARDAVRRLIDRYPRVSVVDRAVSDGGWRIVALIRLNPMIPYSASNYVFGVTGVRFWPFVVSSGIFTLPGAFAYLYLGYVGAEAFAGRTHTTVEWGLLVIGLVLTFVAIAYLAILARRRLADADRRTAAATRRTIAPG